MTVTKKPKRKISTKSASTISRNLRELRRLIDEDNDPIAARIEEAIGSGMDPAEVKRQLIEKGVDPTTYGL